MRTTPYRRSTVHLLRIAVLSAVVLGWELASRAGYLDPLAWSRPSLFLPQLGDLFSGDALVLDLRSTMINIALGFGAGTVCGAVVGSVLTLLPDTARDVLLGYLSSVQAVPLLVFYPLLLTIFGLTRVPIVVIVTIVVVVPVGMSVTNALLSIPVPLRRLARALDLDPVTSFRKISFPAAVPLLFPGIRLGLLLAVVSTIGMEFIVAGRGLGHAVAHSYHAFAVDQMYALILVVCAIAVTIDTLLTWAEQKLRQDRMS